MSIYIKDHCAVRASFRKTVGYIEVMLYLKLKESALKVSGRFCRASLKKEENQVG